MDTAQHITAIDLLLHRAFPARRSCSAVVESGPGFHVAELRVSEALWDLDPADVKELREDFQAESEALVAALSLRWGAPEFLDLTGHLERVAMGMPVRPPLDVLCATVPHVRAWRAEGRWIAVGVGQGDRAEQPFQLMVAIGEEDVA